MRATLISLLAVAAALRAFVVAPYLPEDLSTDIGAESVDEILSIIASSMLAVTTFSLSTMIMAYGAATAHSDRHESALQKVRFWQAGQLPLWAREG